MARNFRNCVKGGKKACSFLPPPLFQHQPGRRLTSKRVCGTKRHGPNIEVQGGSGGGCVARGDASPPTFGKGAGCSPTSSHLHTPLSCQGRSLATPSPTWKIWQFENWKSSCLSIMVVSLRGHAKVYVLHDNVFFKMVATNNLFTRF